MKASDKNLFFWKPYQTKETEIYHQHVFSQWYNANQTFVGKEAIYNIDDISQDDFDRYIDQIEFTTREVWMMYCKALLFAKGNFRKQNLEIAEKILSEVDQKRVQNYGRQLKGFNEVLWNKWKYKIVVNGNYLQFSQNKEMRDILLATNDMEIYEATPVDKIWGIGLTADQAKQINKDDWPGENLLGIAITEVRSIIRNEFKK